MIITHKEWRPKPTEGGPNQEGNLKVDESDAKEGEITHCGEYHMEDGIGMGVEGTLNITIINRDSPTNNQVSKGDQEERRSRQGNRGTK